MWRFHTTLQQICCSQNFPVWHRNVRCIARGAWPQPFPYQLRSASTECAFLTVALSVCPGVVWILLSGRSVSGLLSASIMYVFLSLDGDFVNRPSGPHGPCSSAVVQSWLKSLSGLLIRFLCIILPFGVVTVCFVLDTAMFGLSVKAHSTSDFWCFFLEKRRGSC